MSRTHPSSGGHDALAEAVRRPERRVTRVLLIGFTAEAVDQTDTTLDVDTLRTVIADGDAAVEAAGYETHRAWIGPDHEAGVAEVRRALLAGAFDIVLIGNGVRARPQHTALFEQLVNVVHAFAPEARFASNADPPSTVAALRRNS